MTDRGHHFRSRNSWRKVVHARCVGQVGFASEEAADQARRNEAWPDEGSATDTFQCPLCELWHFGRRSTRYTYRPIPESVMRRYRPLLAEMRATLAAKHPKRAELLRRQAQMYGGSWDTPEEDGQ